MQGHLIHWIARLVQQICRFAGHLGTWLNTPVYWGRTASIPPVDALILFPVETNRLACGLAGIVAYKRRRGAPPPNLAALAQQIATLADNDMARCLEAAVDLKQAYLRGDNTVAELAQTVNALKRQETFGVLFRDVAHQSELARQHAQLQSLIDADSRILQDRLGHLSANDVETLTERLETVKDAAWCLKKEILDNIEKVADLCNGRRETLPAEAIPIFYNINAVLNSIDHLEVRGRDSAGLSLLFILPHDDFGEFRQALEAHDPALIAELENRSAPVILGNRSISIDPTDDHTGPSLVSVTIVYKVAAEIGSLGDNIRFLRREIRNDAVLQRLAGYPHRFHTVSSHTRWASVGAINEANCHPLDNRTPGPAAKAVDGSIHVCLNGDIDNYRSLKADLAAQGFQIPETISTDTKIIPLRIAQYYRDGHDIAEAFRLAVNDFDGSHAISMHSSLAPGKLFLAQRGSGQAIFIGLGDDVYMPTSEVYGFIEQTQRYLKMDGEKVIEGVDGPVQGQIFILDQDSRGGLEGIQARYYDGTPLALTSEDIKATALTSRDINRQAFPHYFLKEISEAPLSVERTLRNRWKIHPDANDRLAIALDTSVIPDPLRQALANNRLQRIYFVGQGTAGVAALACANILRHYLDDPSVQVNALKASELSGFILGENDQPQSMANALVVAISQSGTTTDTNRTVDMVRDRGAFTLAIVNRRDSDLTFKVDGVLYTSSGRDIEMSVASTKAFYSQIVAGAILSLFIAGLTRRRDAAFISQEIDVLRRLPTQMQQVIGMQAAIEASAQRLAPTKTYWAAVGSGPNKASADEIRIKLSELCYKTISSDYVEDKKHIDLSSEPLIIVCAAGARGSVIGDIVKDTAIFKAHKATPVIIADEGEDRFAPYAADIFNVPRAPEHLAPILNTLVGHLWGYYAALSINESSRFLYHFREDIQATMDHYGEQGMDAYEVLLEKKFRHKFVEFYRAFQARKSQNRFPAAMGLGAVADLTLLLKYLVGRLPVSDFELDFGLKGTAANIIDTFFRVISSCINNMSRPIDAIKHQAKTVTVGTSRIMEKPEGLLFRTLDAYGLNISQLTSGNVIVLKNLQTIVERIRGAILYRIGGLDVLGEITEATTIEILRKSGELKPLPSRVETDKRLKGTKEIIVRRGNVYIGKGRKDGRSILIVPAISEQPDRSNLIEYLLLLNIAFRDDVALPAKIKALGGKYTHIRNIVQENNIVWEDQLLETIEMEELFGRSAEKISERIVNQAA
ncbi:MAG: SIS domain-containing protein [Desulfobacterales bacterium]|jgi:glucosamine--fructose-6-phosphate aminotransferase (isomerizing)